jgi:hypothetical protein
MCHLHKHLFLLIFLFIVSHFQMHFHYQVLATGGHLVSLFCRVFRIFFFTLFIWLYQIVLLSLFINFFTSKATTLDKKKRNARQNGNERAIQSTTPRTHYQNDRAHNNIIAGIANDDKLGVTIYINNKRFTAQTDTLSYTSIIDKKTLRQINKTHKRTHMKFKSLKQQYAKGKNRKLPLLSTMVNRMEKWKILDPVSNDDDELIVMVMLLSIYFFYFFYDRENRGQVPNNS